MPLYDRTCDDCGYKEIDRLETVNVIVLISCPKCAATAFRKQLSHPAFCFVRGESACDMGTVLDDRRAAAAAGHGNTTIKMSMNDRGEVTTDDIVKTGGSK